MLRRDVLGKGWVHIVEQTGEDAEVAHGARVRCLPIPYYDDTDARLVRRVLTAQPRHSKVFEHAVLRLGVQLPLFVARQRPLERLGTFSRTNQRDRVTERERYVPQDEQTDAKDRAVRTEASFDRYVRLVFSGRRSVRARGLIPRVAYTGFVPAANARSPLNGLGKRLDKGAQWEHRQYARAMLAMFGRGMPMAAGAFGEGVLHR